LHRRLIDIYFAVVKIGTSWGTEKIIISTKEINNQQFKGRAAFMAIRDLRCLIERIE
jgi:hypothetical protein